MNDSTVQWVLFAIVTLILWAVTWPYRKVLAIIGRLRSKPCAICGRRIPGARRPAVHIACRWATEPPTLVSDTDAFWAGEDSQWH